LSAKVGSNTPGAELTAARLALLQNPPNPAVLATLLAAVRAQVLRDKLNMDVDWMMKLMEEYGPLDWRNPFALTLYWATYGDMATKGVLNINPNDSMNTVRDIFFALANLFRAGKMVLEPSFEHPNRSFLQLLPDSRYIKHLHRAYLKFGKEQFGDDPRFKEGTSGPNYWNGHKNFLATAIRQLYLEGGAEKLAEAKDYFFYLREYDREDDGQVKAMYQMPFDDFVLQTIFESLETQVNAQAFIAGLLLRSLEELGNDNAAGSLDAFDQARKAWNYYMRDTATDRNARRLLEPVGVIRRDAALVYFQSPEYSLLQKSRVWRNLDRLTRQATYDSVRPYVEAECAENDPPYDAAKVLPEPPGMDDFRKSPDERMEGLKRLDASTSQGEKPND
jgi:hypothetical protein